MDAKIIELWDRQRGGGKARPLHRGAYPPRGYCAIVVGLLEHSGVHVSELARRIGEDQGNVSVYLNRLADLGLARFVQEQEGYGRNGGGLPAHFWELTDVGRDMARMIKGVA